LAVRETSRWISGARKAAVFPEPVRAMATTCEPV
jgi:hypothetical protein